MPVKSAMDLLVLLLYANRNEKVEGITRLVKLLFLLVEEGGFEKFREECDFEAYSYGPWSAEVFNYRETLDQIGALEIEEKPVEVFDEDYLKVADEQYVENLPPAQMKERKIETFSLTEDGLKIGRVLWERLSQEERLAISNIKERYNHMSLHDLLRYVYSRYGEFTGKSKIRRKVLTPEKEFRQRFPSSRVDKVLFNLVGTQPAMSLEEEKRAVREIIRERMES